MEIEASINKKKEIYSSLLDFIDATDDIDGKFNKLINIFEDQKILQKKRDILEIFQLISKIDDNHHRNASFYAKLEKIFQYFFNYTEFPLSVSEIFQTYKTNRRILYLFLEKKFINPEKIKSQLFLKQEYRLFLYPVLKSFFKESSIKFIEDEISQMGYEDIETYAKKCQKGENDSYICSLIREDSVENFISHVNRNNISLMGTITQSQFETNTFLMQKKVTLIEYATFFGSIQIFQYLKNYKVPLKSSLWHFSIHSDNAELIHLLEENHVEPPEGDYEQILKESIKCHHNNVADYIRDNFLNENEGENLNENQLNDKFDRCIIDSLNYYYFPNKVDHLISNPKKKNCFSISNLCFSLSKVSIPSSITKIGDSSFSECSSLTEIIIPSSIVSIGNFAFKNCFSIKQISIPSSVKSIGKGAFSGCSSLIEMIIPTSVTEISDELFNDCSSMIKISIHSSVSVFGRKVFNGIKTLEISGDIKKIYKNMFNGCTSLVEIKIPSIIESIEDFAFNECTALNSIVIPSSVSEIGERSFAQCSSLKEINIPSSVCKIGKEAFYCCSCLNIMTIPQKVTSIEKSTFYICSSLKIVNIPSSVTSIGDNAFSLCLLLNKVKIPSSVISIGNNAFNGCSCLDEIEIPSSVKSIGECAFALCESLKEIKIPSSVISIGNNVFSLCSSLKMIYVLSSINIELLGIGNDVKVIKI